MKNEKSENQKERKGRKDKKEIKVRNRAREKGTDKDLKFEADNDAQVEHHIELRLRQVESSRLHFPWSSSIQGKTLRILLHRTRARDQLEPTTRFLRASKQERCDYVFLIIHTLLEHFLTRIIMDCVFFRKS